MHVSCRPRMQEIPVSRCLNNDMSCVYSFPPCIAPTYTSQAGLCVTKISTLLRGKQIAKGGVCGGAGHARMMAVVIVHEEACT